MTEKHLQVLLQVMVYDCTISEDNFALQPKLIKMEENAYRPQLLMICVYIKMKAFELTKRLTKYFRLWSLSRREGKSVQVSPC